MILNQVKAENYCIDTFTGCTKLHAGVIGSTENRFKQDRWYCEAIQPLNFKVNSKLQLK